jgi:hypothetical protein
MRSECEADYLTRINIKNECTSMTFIRHHKEHATTGTIISVTAIKPFGSILKQQTIRQVAENGADL